MHDPRGAGAGSRVLGTLVHDKGEAAVRTFLADQQLVLTQDHRQLTEWVVRGRYPIGIAISPEQFKLLADQGLSIDHVKPLTGDDPGLYGLNAGFGSLMVVNKAPHPNAVKIFVDWLLSPEGQAIFAEQSTYNSRRTDVPVVAPDRAVDPRLDLVNLAKEKDNHWRERGQELAREYLKQ